jgi:nucleotide-binding universal stress UspA family protein
MGSATPHADGMGARSILRNVLIPDDGEQADDIAITIGAELASRMNGHAEVVSVIGAGPSEAEQTELGHDALRLRVAGLRTRVIVGSDVPLELQQAAMEADAILCLSSSGRTAVTEGLIGSVSGSVIRHSPRAIVVVGPHCVPLSGRQLAIAVDGSTAGEWIIEQALDLAEATGLEPVLYHVARHPDDRSADVAESASLAALADRHARPGHPIGYELLHDHRVGRALADLTCRSDVAILAISSHRLQPHERILSPSIAQHLIRHARCPLYVGAREIPAEPPFDHGSSPRVVVGVDGSSADRWAVEYAADTAARRGATLEIIHAWPRNWYLLTDGAATGTTANMAQREAEEILGRAVTMAHEFAPHIAVLPWLAGRLASDALSEASHGADLVVVGERRYNLVEEAVLGSTTTDVLHRVRVPVVVVPEPI